MINILPAQQKITLKKEYALRRLTVALGMTSVALLISFLLLLPSYFLSQVRANIIKADLEHSKRILDTELQPEAVTNELSAAIRDAADLKPFVPPDSVSELIGIFERKPATISITSFSFQNQIEQPVIVLQGKAADRESLTAFGKSLEERVEFASVELPVSNFVKESNITFSMTVTLK